MQRNANRIKRPLRAHQEDGSSTTDESDFVLFKGTYISKRLLDKVLAVQVVHTFDDVEEEDVYAVVLSTEHNTICVSKKYLSRKAAHAHAKRLMTDVVIPSRRKDRTASTNCLTGLFHRIRR